MNEQQRETGNVGYINQFEGMKDIADYIKGLAYVMNRTFSQPTEREFFDFTYSAMLIANKKDCVQDRDVQYLLEMFEENNRDKPNYEVAIKFAEHTFEQLGSDVQKNMSRFVEQLRLKCDL